MSEPILTISGLDVRYGQSHILQGVDLVVGDEPLALIGRNGMGKTTLCNAITGLVPAFGGSILLRGVELTSLKPHQIARSGIGYVPQGRRVFPSLSVAEHLKMVAPRNGDGWTVKRIYELFPPLATRKGHGAMQLSGGEQQMLAIARALLLNPHLLIMDEPSEGLAPIVIQGVWEAVGKLKAQGLSILLVEQNTALALKLVDHVHVMSKGRVVYSASPQELWANEDVKSNYLGI